jgi:hypothetical protein
MKKIIAVLIGFIVFSGIASAQEAKTKLTGAGTLDDPISTNSVTDSKVTTEGTMETNINQPPPSAIAPQFSGGMNSDLCTIGVAGAVQTQILGISAGTTFTEDNCIRLKNAKTMYDMGMKVAAVSIMCEDDNVFQSMLHAGTPCPYNGTIGAEARLGWETDVEKPKEKSKFMEKLNLNVEKTIMGVGSILLVLVLLL